jgi:hypothetical protein
VEPTAAFAQLQLGFIDPIQWRYEVIRPLVLFADRTATQRAQETETHPDTVRMLQRRFRQLGMLGLVPANLEVTPRGRAPRVPDAVRQEIDRLKALYAGFHYRELARICSSPSATRSITTRPSSCGTKAPSPLPSRPLRGTIAPLLITPILTCRSPGCTTKVGTR